MALDGQRLTFDQGGSQVTTISIQPTAGANNGTAGVAFAAEPNRGKVGGQRVKNLAVTAFRSLDGLPVQNP